MAILIILALGLGLPALTVFGVWFVGREYDRHPWVRKVLDAEASLYFPDLPKSYTDQTPGGWDDRP